MTVNQMFKAIALNNNQTVKIQDCTKHYTYESDIGLLSFEDSYEVHNDVFEGYSEFIEHLKKLNVDFFEVKNDCITIWTK